MRRRGYFSDTPITGEFRWIPAEADGPGIFDITVVVTDSRTPALSDRKTFPVTVIEVNSVPVLAPIGNQTVNESEELTFVASVTDSDFPANALVFSLGPGAPEGASIDPTTGAFRWTPTEDEGPGTFNVTIQVADNGSPMRIDQQTIQIQVAEVNTGLTIDPILPQTIEVGIELSFFVTATDEDIPADSLTFYLEPGAPIGATIDPITGRFSWTPPLDFLPRTVSITLRVEDDGIPAISSTQTFDVEVTGEPVDILLAESGQFVVEHTVSVELGQTAGKRVIRFDLANVFDTTDTLAAVEDTFLVYLIDPQDPSQTLLDRGQNGTAVFSLAGNEAEFVPGLVRFDGTTVEIDVTSLGDLTEGTLLFQLLNQDTDDGTRIAIDSLTNVVLEEDRMALGFFDSNSLATIGSAVDLAGYTPAVDVEIEVTNIRFDSATGEYRAQLTLHNKGQNIGRRVVVVLPGLPNGVSVLESAGMAPNGDPYFIFENAIAPGGLGSQQSSSVIEIAISNLSQTRFSLQPEILTAGPNLAPSLGTISPVTIMPGQHLEIVLAANDPDGDPLRFGITSATTLPTTRLTLDGHVTFSPEAGQEGSYVATVAVSDGALTTTQTFVIDVLPDPLTTTRITGEIRNINDVPLEGVRVSVENAEAFTNANGIFFLEFTGTDIPLELSIHGDEIEGTERFAFLGKRFTSFLGREVIAGTLNTIVRPIFLPTLDTVNVTEISQDSDTVVTNAQLPGVSLLISQGSAVDQEGNPIQGAIGVMEVALDRTPAELPPHLLPDTVYAVFTLDTTGVQFNIPAGLTVPNKAGYSPGTTMDLWEVDHNTGKFAIFGQGVVSADGTLIEPVPGQGGVVSGIGGRNSTNWRVYVPTTGDLTNGTDPAECPCEDTRPLTSEVGLLTGYLTEQHDLAGYQSQGISRSISLVYDSARANPTKTVRFSYDVDGGLVHVSQARNPPSNQVLFAELSVFDGSVTSQVFDSRSSTLNSGDGKHLWSGNGLQIGDTVNGSILVDASGFRTGTYDYDLRSGFGLSTSNQVTGTSRAIEDTFVVVNSIGSPFGDGWGIAGVQEIIEETSLQKRLAKSVLLVDGDGSELLFINSPVPGQEGVFFSPPGDFSTLEKLPDGRYRRTLTDQTVYQFNGANKLETVTDRNGNVTRYEYDAAGNISKIIDPVGLETVFEYQNGMISRITNPDGRETILQVDGEGDLIMVLDPDGAERRWGYDARNLMVSETTNRGFTETIQYNNGGQVTGAIRADGSNVTVASVESRLSIGLGINNSGSLPTLNVNFQREAFIADGNGAQTRYELDRGGLISGITDTLGTVAKVTRNSQNRITSNRDGLGFETNSNYDSRGNVLKITDEAVRSVAIETPLFPGEKFLVGMDPISMTKGDFNGDGIIDIATANLSSNDVSLLLGNGDGTFQTQLRFDMGDAVNSITSADFNEDGVADLVTSISSTDEVSILLGNGDGTFQAQQRLNTGLAPTSVTTGDFNGDGITDIATANFSSQDVSILLGNGDGTFQAQLRFTVGVGPTSMIAGDFNGDGLTDLATANQSTSDVSVLLGNGDGTFQNQQSFAAGIQPNSVTTGDFNGDGVTDLVVANLFSDVSVLLGNGNGTFQTQLRFPVGDITTSVSTGDFNGDGMTDLAATNFVSGGMSILLGNGDGTFQTQIRLTQGNLPLAMTTGDFNRDGITDIATSNKSSDDVSVLLGNGDGTFQTQFPLITDDVPSSVATGDFNGDGITDLAVANNSTDVSVLLGNGDGTFLTQQQFPVGDGATSVTTGDFNGDGITDLATANRATSDLLVLLGNGNGTFQAQQRFNAGDFPTSVTTGDFNRDGVTDLATSNGLSDDVSVLLGNGDGTFQAQQRFNVGDSPTSVTTGDFNGDGVTDLATSNGTSDDLSVLLGNGDGTFQSQQRFNVGDNPTSVTTGDFNGDGLTDLATSNSLSGDASVMLGNGDGTFQVQQRFAAGFGANSLTMGDFNWDGRTDLAITTYSTVSDNDLTVVLLGNGNGTFQARRFYTVGEGAYSVATGDFNGDGKADLVTSNSLSNDVSVLLGIGNVSGAFQVQRRFAVGDGTNSLTKGDFNGDGVIDLATANDRSDDVSVRLGNGDGTFQTQIRLTQGNLPLAMTTGDFNGDGVTDLATANNGSSDVSVLLGNGDGTFQTQWRFTVADDPSSLTTGDFNGDGVTDLATSSPLQLSEIVSVLLGNGDGTFQSLLQFTADTPSSISITSGDFNGDGVTDLAIGSFFGGVSILLSNGDGTFQTEQQFPLGGIPQSLSTGDFNGDGVTDLATGNFIFEGNPNMNATVSVLLGNGDGTFQSPRLFGTGESVILTTGDFNGDGVTDLATATVSFDDVSIFLGNGDGTFKAQRRFAIGSIPDSLVTGDFNGDGLTDLATSIHNSNEVSLLLNQSGASGGGTSGGGAQPRTFTYDETFNQLVSSTDNRGRSTTFDIDPDTGNTLEIIRPGNLRTGFSYIQSGQVEMTTDELGRVTRFEYNEFGQTTAITLALGTPEQGVQRFEYDEAGNQTAFIDENNNRTEFEYDALNRLTLTRDPQGNETQFEYDEAGNLVKTTDARGNVTQNEFDARDRLVRTTDANGKTTSFAYDKEGNLIRVVDPLGNITSNQYDVRNRLTTTIDPDGGVTRFRYDRDDNLIVLTDPVGNTTLFGYDSRDRLVREIDPLGNATDYVYDAADNLIEKTDRNQRVTRFEYDDLDRLITEIWVDGGNTIDYTYDDVGNLLTVQDAFSSLTFTYDTRDRVHTVDNAGTPGAPNVVLTYTYDATGNVTSVADVIDGQTGATTVYEYDSLNLTTSIEQTGPSVSAKAVDFVYNQLGQFAEIARYSDIARSNLVARTEYTYDALNRLTDLDHINALDEVFSFFDFEFDDSSRITQITDVDGVTNYSYDDRSQLTGADRGASDPRGDESYAYDANGNRTNSHLHNGGYVTGPGNRLLSDGTYDYQYDAEGNMTRRTEIATGDYRIFAWDHRIRLIRVTDFSSAGTVTQEVEFAYDALDRRILKTVDTDGEGPQVESTLHFVYDRDDALFDFFDPDSGGLAIPALVQRYLHGPGIDQVLAQEVATETILWQLTDHLGTVRVLTDGTDHIANFIQYDSFGNIASQSDPSKHTRYLFTGREFDEEINLYYFRARYYDAVIGRFILEDPIGFASGDDNVVRYTKNQPLIFLDPFGLENETVYDSNGNIIGSRNIGLESPLLDPIDFIPVAGVVNGINKLRKARAAAKATKASTALNKAQTDNLERFRKKLPKDACEPTIKELPGGGKALQSEVPGRVPGSKAVYEKQIDATGKTINYTKTTYTPDGRIAHVKQKFP